MAYKEETLKVTYSGKANKPFTVEYEVYWYKSSKMEKYTFKNCDLMFVRLFAAGKWFPIDKHFKEVYSSKEIVLTKHT